MLIQFRVGHVTGDAHADSIEGVVAEWEKYKKLAATATDKTPGYDHFVLTGSMVLRPPEKQKT